MRTAAIYGLVDLVSWEPQKFHGTWMHGRSKLWHQLEKVFMRERDQLKVYKCKNASMLVDSGHYSTRLQVRCKKPHPPTKTARKKVMQRDLDACFGMEADEELKKAVVMDIAKRWKGGCANKVPVGGCEGTVFSNTADSLTAV